MDRQKKQIPMDEQIKLWEEEINTKGIGIGLYISKKITNIFGGEISVKSKPGIGSVFTFSFALEEFVN